MKKVVLILFCVMVGVVLYGKDDVVRVSAMYDYLSDDRNETRDQAEQKAKERAKEKALEERFGVDVSRVNTTYQQNRTRGDETESVSNFFSIGGTSVRGEWIETIKEEVKEVTYQHDFWHVRVYVEGKARNSSVAHADVQTMIVKWTDEKYSHDYFNDGDPFYLRLISPVDGYLCVYLVDGEQNAYCLLPTEDNGSGVQEIAANKEYLFLDEYTLTTQRRVEENVLYIVFSPHKFIKAGDKKGGKNWRDEQLPRELDYGSFLTWLSKNQLKDAEMVVKTSIVTIRK